MIEELLKDHEMYHSTFQQDYFITGAEATPYGQYKQALREISTRVDSIKNSEWELEKLLVEIEEQKEKAKKGKKFERKYAEIEIKRKFHQAEQVDKSIDAVKKELERFVQHGIALKKQIGDLTPEKSYELEKELYFEKCKEMLVTDWACLSRIQPQTYELMMSLPMSKRIEFAEYFKNQEALISEIEIKNKNNIGKECLLEI